MQYVDTIKIKRIKCKLVIKVTNRKTATKKKSKEYLTLLVNGVRREKSSVDTK